MSGNVPEIPTNGWRLGIVESGPVAPVRAETGPWTGSSGTFSSGSDDVPAGTGEGADIAFDTTGKFVEVNGTLVTTQAGGDAIMAMEQVLMNRNVLETLTDDFAGRFYMSSRDGGTLKIFTGARPTPAVVGWPDDVSGYDPVLTTGDGLS